MAFKKQSFQAKKLQLVSLFDVVFLLILFFLVTRVVSVIGQKYSEVDIRTPENKPGQAQICIQVIPLGDGQTGYYWIDSEAIASVGLQPNATRDEIRNALARLSWLRLDQLLDSLDARKQQIRREQSNGIHKEYFIVVRCPGNIPYSAIIEVLGAIKGHSGDELHNLRYGCLEGTFQQLYNAWNLTYENEQIPGSNLMRPVLRISF